MARPLDLHRLLDIASKHTSGADVGKYLNLSTWLPRNLQRLTALGLDDGVPRRVLDIGCGAGYFAYFCAMLGHEVVAADIKRRDPLYVDLTEALGVRVTSIDITAFEKLPDDLGMFDVVTAFMVCFNGHRTSHVWKTHEWRFFLDDLYTHMHTGGIICMELNRELDAATCYTPELELFFKQRGAVFTGHYPHAVTPSGHRLVIRRP